MGILLIRQKEVWREVEGKMQGIRQSIKFLQQI